MSRAAPLPYRQQVQVDVGGTVVLRTSERPAAATYTVWRDGSQVVTSSAAGVADVGDGSHISCAIPAGLELGLDYEARVSIDSGPPRRVIFDVLRTTLGPLVDLASMRPTDRRYIDAEAARAQLTPELFVERLGARARGRLQGMLQGLLSGQDIRQRLPRAVLDTDRLVEVERALAISMLHADRTTGTGLDGEDAAAELAGRYAKEAADLFAGLGPLRIDDDGDGIADRAVVSGSIQMVRVQG